jgi:enoyl ACP reductase
MPSFAGRRYLITGVLNEESIAWHVAAALQCEGAEVVLTSFGRAARIARKAAGLLPGPADVLELDVTDPEAFPALTAELERRWGALDGALHSVAFAPADSIDGGLLTAPAGSVLHGFGVSAYSLQLLARSVAPLMSGRAGSIVGMTVDSSRALPGYDWMGVYKAGLEAVARYLALYLGPSGIRVNLVNSGPLSTVSGRGLACFGPLAEHSERWAPLGWDRDDPDRVVGAVLFLLSDWSRVTTGQVLHADGGLHAVVAGITGPPASTAGGADLA